MIIWVNGAFGAGKTQTAFELHRRIQNSYVYDPENLGYFMRKNMPDNIRHKDDFQDYEIWRSMNYSFIKYIEEEYNGIVIIPMTIVNPQYFEEIVGQLQRDGIIVRHFALMASKETLLRRLKSRGDGAGTWPAKQIDRCLEGLSNDVFETHMDTENMSVDEVAEKIALSAGIELLPERKGRVWKKVGRIKIQLKHIRFFNV